LRIEPDPVDEPTKANQTVERLPKETTENMATKALSDVSHDIV